MADGKWIALACRRGETSKIVSNFIAKVTA
jgi:hypothetical protein